MGIYIEFSVGYLFYDTVLMFIIDTSRSIKENLYEFITSCIYCNFELLFCLYLSLWFSFINIVVKSF